MSLSRGLVEMGAGYLAVGIVFASRTVAPVHAHITLLGFALMTVFGIGCRMIPGLAAGMLPKPHFWLHQVGALLLLLGLFLMLTGRMAEARIGPIFPVLEGAILPGAVLWLAGVMRHA